MPQGLRSALGILVVAAVLGTAVWRLLAPTAHAGLCDLSAQRCSISLGNQDFEVESIPRRPAADDTLRLVVTPTGEPSRAPADDPIEAEFSMPGMQMTGADGGELIVGLKVAENGTFEGRIQLPSCPMGRSLWQVTLRDAATKSTAELALHVQQ
ncbi:MAG: hypothetical protein AAGC60_04980 [Acidobacteriota bacterium]